MGKVYFIACCFPPFGRGNALTNACVANHLAEDFDLEVVCMEQEEGLLISSPPDSSLVGQLHPRVQVRRIRAARWGGLNELLYAAGLLPCYYLNWAWKVWRQRHTLFRSRPGVLFAVYPVFSDLVVAYWLHRQYNYPLVVDFRDDFSGVMARGWRRVFKGLYHWVEGRLLERAARVSVTTEKLKADLVARHGLTPEKVAVVYNIVPERAPQSPRTENPLLRLVYAGAMSRIQQPEVLVQAYARLHERWPQVRQHLQVDLYGPASPYFKLHIQQHLVPGTRFHGFLNHAQMAGQFAKTDLGFLSLGDPVFAYATPTKLFEYIEYEIPVVAVLPPGAARDLIEQHELGLVVDIGDVEGLAACLKRLCCAPELRARLRANLARVRPLFRPEAQVQKWRALLEEASSTGEASGVGPFAHSRRPSLAGCEETAPRLTIL